MGHISEDIGREGILERWNRLPSSNPDQNGDAWFYHNWVVMNIKSDWKVLRRLPDCQYSDEGLPTFSDDEEARDYCEHQPLDEYISHVAIEEAIGHYRLRYEWCEIEIDPFGKSYFRNQFFVMPSGYGTWRVGQSKGEGWEIGALDFATLSEAQTHVLNQIQDNAA